MPDLEELEVQLLKQEAYNAIANIMAKFVHYYARYQGNEIVALFADMPDTRAETVFGVFDGIEGVRRCFTTPNPILSEKDGLEGEMRIRPIAVPIIVVSDDLQTAKASAFVPGIYGTKTHEGKAAGGWYYAAYAWDMILIDGAWKIWHFHEYSRFQTPYDTQWADIPPFDPYRVNGTTKKEFFELKDDGIPDRRPTSAWGYHTYGLYPNDQPVIPQPYASYDPKKAY